MPTLFEPELSRIILICLMLVPAICISVAAYILRLVGGFPARRWQPRRHIIFRFFLYICFMGGFVFYADLSWTKLSPNVSSGDSFWWLPLAWWSALVGISLLWEAAIDRSWTKWGIVALTIAYPVLQIVYAIPIFTWKPGETPWVKPEWDMVSVWDRTQAAFAIVFWVTMLSLLLYHRCQAGKEIKMAKSAPVEDKDDSVQP